MEKKPKLKWESDVAINPGFQRRRPKSGPDDDATSESDKAWSSVEPGLNNIFPLRLPEIFSRGGWRRNCFYI